MVKVISKKLLSITLMAIMTLSIIGVAGVSTQVSACNVPNWGPWSPHATPDWHVRYCKTSGCSDMMYGPHQWMASMPLVQECRVCGALKKM